MSAYCFDSKSYDLAVHFLPNGNEDVWNALAQEIQDTVERWCEFDPRSPESEQISEKGEDHEPV